jgi:hypothetical protein
MHVFEPLSLIPPWNKQMDNFIESTMFFTNKFMSNKRIVIIMHANDLWVLKEIQSLLETSWRFAWSGSLLTQAPRWVARMHILRYHKFLFLHMYLCFAFNECWDWPEFCIFLIDAYKSCHPSCEKSSSKHHVFLKVLIFCPFCQVGQKGY